MSTNPASGTAPSLARLLAAVLILTGSAGTVVAAPAPVEAGGAADGERTSTTRHHISGGRDQPQKLAETSEEYAPLVTTGPRDGSDTRARFAKPGAGSTEAEAGGYDFWVYDADVIVFNDDDNDGFYHGIDVLFDADTIYAAADVYAVLYLSLEGGPWNEYAVTEDFTLFGATATDEYVLVTELMSGYPTGSYDLLIEIFDAYDGSFLADFGPADSSAVAYLPLEDYDRDAPLRAPVVHHHGGGGAIDGWLVAAFLLLLFGSFIRKLWRRRNDVLMRIDAPPPCWQGQDQHRIRE